MHCPSLCHFLPLSTPHTTSTSLTCTDHSCIFPGVTVMHSKTTMGTLSEAGFTATAVHIAVPNWTTSPSKNSKPWCPHSCAIAQLTTDHCGITQVPTTTTHSHPATTVEDLHTSLSLTGPSNQSKGNWKGESDQERVGWTGRCRGHTVVHRMKPTSTNYHCHFRQAISYTAHTREDLLYNPKCTHAFQQVRTARDIGNVL